MGRLAALRNVTLSATFLGAWVALSLVALTFFILPGGPDYRPHSWYLFGTIHPGYPSGVIVAHLVGGLIAGRVARVSPGLNGALSALSVPLVLIICYAISGLAYNLAVHGPLGLVPDRLASTSNIREFVTDEEMAGFFIVSLMFTVYVFLSISAGYLGGKLGGRLRLSPRDVSRRP